VTGATLVLSSALYPNHCS